MTVRKVWVFIRPERLTIVLFLLVTFVVFIGLCRTLISATESQQYTAVQLPNSELEKMSGLCGIAELDSREKKQCIQEITTVRRGD